MMEQTIKNFIQDFKSTSYYEYIYKKPGVIMSYVAGSRLNNAASLLSDFDIIIITADNAKIEDTGIRFKYKDIYTVHFYYHTVSSFLANTYTMADNLYGLMQMHNLDRSLLIYENLEYSSFIDRFFEKKLVVSKLAMLKYIKSFDRILADVYDTHTLATKYYHKYLYHLCKCYYVIARLEQDTALLLQAKYSAHEGLSEENIEKIIKILQTLKITADYYSMDELVTQFEAHKLYILNEK